MVKFILILQMCYATQNMCLPPMELTTIYSSYKECGLAGYNQSSSIIQEMDSKLINDNKILIKFWCLEKKVENEKKIDT